MSFLFNKRIYNNPNKQKNAVLKAILYWEYKKFAHYTCSVDSHTNIYLGAFYCILKETQQ